MLWAAPVMPRQTALSGAQRDDAVQARQDRALAAAGDSAESDAAVGWLLDYYRHTVLAAGQHIVTRAVPLGRPPPGRPPAGIPDPSTVGQAAAWLEAERANVHAAAEYAAGSGRPLQAVHRWAGAVTVSSAGAPRAGTRKAPATPTSTCTAPVRAGRQTSA